MPRILYVPCAQLVLLAGRQAGSEADHYVLLAAYRILQLP